jgi:hypothetical protein
MISQIIHYFHQNNLSVKNAFIIIFLVFHTIASATDYYISSSGNDSNNGLSSSAPWKTIAKVNASSFSPGDTIFFRKGDTWRERLIVPSSGNLGAYIVFSSYGAGLAPKILGSTEVTAWTKFSGNEWYSTNTVLDPYALEYYGNIYFKEKDGDISWGRVKKSTVENLKVEYDWTYYANHIYIYSDTDPNTRYSGVEVTQRTGCIELNNKNYITLNGFDIAYSGTHGIGELWPATNITGLIVKNCLVHHIGIKTIGYGIEAWHSNTLIQNNIVHDSGRRNISLNIYSGEADVHNIIVENNTLYRGFHTTGVDLDITGVGTIDNVIIRKNLIYDDISETLDQIESYHSNGIFAQEESTGKITNLYVYDNIIKNTTMIGICILNVTSSFIYNNTLYGVNPNLNLTDDGNALVFIGGLSNSIIRNNIIYNNISASTLSNYGCLHINTSGTVTSDYNLFYNTDPIAQMIAWAPLGGRIISQLATYKFNSGQDVHSLTPANPLFVSSTDYHLQVNSPAIIAGISVGLTTDYEGNTFKDPPSIGAYEYVSKLTGSNYKEKKIIIYPNPTHDFVNISVGDPTIIPLILKISDFSGKIVFTDLIEQSITTIQISRYLITGMYNITLVSNSLFLYSQKLIISK